jgi:hypothetical protein
VATAAISKEPQLMHASLNPEQTPEQAFQLTVIQRPDLSHAMEVQVQRYERSFGVKFDLVTVFSRDLFWEHHKAHEPAHNDFFHVECMSSPLVLSHFDTLTRIANVEEREPDAEERLEYRNALIAIYRTLPIPPRTTLNLRSTLVVGIQREGALLANLLDRQPRGVGIKPHAKRIPFDHGLLVGTTGTADVVGHFDLGVIFDGAIASGATVIAFMNQLRPHVDRFEIFSVHATYQGMQAIADFAADKEISVRLVVGHATSGLDDHYYATNARGQLIVGDLGDTLLPRER